MTKKRSPFIKGPAPELPEREESHFVPKVKPNSEIAIVPVVSMSECILPQDGMHEFWNVNPAVFIPCIQSFSDCPACRVDHELDGRIPRFKAYLPVLTKKSIAESKVLLLPHTISIHNELKTNDEALDGGIAGRELKIVRKGHDYKTTRYSVVSTGRRVNISKIEVPTDEEMFSWIGPSTREEIAEALTEAKIRFAETGEEEVELEEVEEEVADFEYDEEDVEELWGGV